LRLVIAKPGSEADYGKPEPAFAHCDLRPHPLGPLVFRRSGAKDCVPVGGGPAPVGPGHGSQWGLVI